MEQLQSISREYVLDEIFKYLVKFGFSDIQLAEISCFINIGEDAFAEMFDKTENVLEEALKYGFGKHINEILNYINFELEHKSFFDNIIREVTKHSAELRLICSAASSVEYGETMKMCSAEYAALYMQSSAKIAEKLNCTEDEIAPVLRMFLSIIHDYIIWDDIEVARMQIEYVYAVMLHRLGYKFR